jgi:hypothetical protein
MAKRLLLFLLLCALAIGVWHLASRPRGTAPPAVASIQGESSGISPLTASSGPPGLAVGTPAPPAVFPTPELSPGPAANPAPPPATPFLMGAADTTPAMNPATVLSNMRITVNQYGSMFGGNPVGTNPEITSALNGDNPKQVKFIKEELGLRINGRGELVDYWGTPFFFHQISGTEMEIRSAGPDKVMWTSDDLVTK